MILSWVSSPRSASAGFNVSRGPSSPVWMTIINGRLAWPSTTISSSPVHFIFEPNFPLDADQMAAGSPESECFSGLNAEKYVRRPVMTLVPVRIPVLMMSGLSGASASLTSRAISI